VTGRTCRRNSCRSGGVWAQKPAMRE
jgi:hypothetical protein